MCFIGIDPLKLGVPHELRVDAGAAELGEFRRAQVVPGRSGDGIGVSGIRVATVVHVPGWPSPIRPDPEIVVRLHDAEQRIGSLDRLRMIRSEVLGLR